MPPVRAAAIRTPEAAAGAASSAKAQATDDHI
jgi:hypothetical protein